MEIKNLNLKKFKEELIFIPLGGSDEIGLNCNLYHYNGKWLIVDCGLGFVKMVPGINLIVPDTTIFKKLKNDIVGIFITHIHEDHLGAIQYVWQDIQVPIYTSKFTKLFLQEKLKEYSFAKDVKIIEINEGQKLKLDPFEIESLNLTHSTPEMNALLITTPNGKILHTGDWKFDNDPVIGSKSNINRLKQLGNQKELLATVCDSTNIFSTGKNHSEGELYDSLYDLIKERNGAIVFTMFASNVARLKTVSEIAKKTKRKLVIVGLSFIKLVKIAREMGYLDEDVEILKDEDLKDYKKRNLIILATGCQGETNAGMDKLVNGTLRNIRLHGGDTVIFSASVIPGNERDLIYLYNKLSKKNVEVLTDKNYLVHVSGHYTLDDLRNFYAYTKPKMTIAVHGEQMHLVEHQRVAKECGIANTIKSSNGMILKISEDKTEKIGQITTKISFVDGRRLLDADDEIIRTRKKLEDAGALFINLVIDNRYKMLSNPIISAPGGYNFEKDRSMYEIFLEDIRDTYLKTIRQIKQIRETNLRRFATDAEREHLIEQRVRNAVYKIYDEDIGKRPFVEIFFSRITSITQN
jgi:ribonuclease J